MPVEQPDSDRGQAEGARPVRVGLAARRFAAGTTAGAAGLTVALLAGATWSVALLVAWDIAAVIVLYRVWSKVAQLDAEATAVVANGEDDSHAAAEAALLGAGVASLIAVAFTLADAGHAHDVRRGR